MMMNFLAPLGYYGDGVDSLAAVGRRRPAN